MKPKLMYTESGTQFILDALEIKTNIPTDKIIGIYKMNDGSIKIFENNIDMLNYVDIMGK